MVENASEKPAEKPTEKPAEKPTKKPAAKKPPLAEDGIKGDFFSPMGVILFLIAILVDTAGLIVFLLGTWFGIDDFGILDITGLVLVGGLMYMHSGTVTATKGAEKAVKKIGTQILKRVGVAFLGELIPYFGGAAPCWTIAVYFHLKNS